MYLPDFQQYAVLQDNFKISLWMLLLKKKIILLQHS